MHGPDKSSDTISVFENNDPTLRFALRITTVETNGARTTQPYDVSDGFTAEFFIKDGPNSPDPSPVGITDIPDSPNGDIVHVALSAADIGSPRTCWCRLDVISIDGKRSTVHASQFKVENV